MSFQDLDPLEKHLNKSVYEMTAEDLVTYIKTYMSTVYGLQLMVDPSVPRERAVFKGLKTVYGDDAGLIVKWVFWKYQGKYDGEFVHYFNFQRSRKWWTDLMYQEAQLQLQKESKSVATRTEGSSEWNGFVSRL